MQLVNVNIPFDLSSILKWYKIHIATILWFSLSLFKSNLEIIVYLFFFNKKILKRRTSLGNKPALIIWDRTTESNDKFKSKRNVMFNKSSCWHGIKRANLMIAFSSLF